MEYRILNKGIWNIEVTNLPKKSGELIFQSLPEGHRILPESKSFTRLQMCYLGKNPISLSPRALLREERETGFSSGRHSQPEVGNEQDGQEQKSSLEGGGLRSECETRRRVLVLEALELENGQNNPWHQHLSSRKLSGREQPHWYLSCQNTAIRAFRNSMIKIKNLSPLNIKNYEN